MKKFENKTQNNKELAIKVGTVVPQDAANLAFYSNESISPKNNLAVIDLSASIPENKSSIKTGIKTFFANELGILEDENGNTIFPTPNLTISDTFINKIYQTQMLEESEINSVEFFHYYYVSRFFTAVRGTLNFDDLSEFLDDTRIKILNIKVIDSNNQEYVDVNTGKKKYKILLEPFLTEENVEDSEIAHRIIVGLDATKPNGLRLVYDKVECDSDGKITKQNLRYSETINAHQYFKNNPEESYVVDNSFRKKVYSVKKYNKKYSEIFSDNFDSSGYNVFVPKKALADNRTFEVFNWRLIARSKQSLNLDLVDYFWEQQENINQKTINVAVLFDSTDTTSLDIIEPYVFYRLETSPFNFSKHIFVNPLATQNANEINALEVAKNEASYWMVDINEVDTLEVFDVVSFCPTKKLSQKSVELISNYVRLQNGTIIVDGSNYPSNEPFLIPELYIEQTLSSESPPYYEYVETNKILDENQNGGWNINQSIFENSDLGIFGSKKQKYRHINSLIPLEKSFLNIGSSESTAKSVGCLVEFTGVKDALSQGNIIFTSFPFLEYCNSIYSITGSSQYSYLRYGVIDSNSEDTAIEEENKNVLSAIVEGPFKFFYNCISYGLYSRAYAGRLLDTRSSIFNYVGEWNSSWAMNSDALLPSEKEKYFTNISVSNTQEKQARDLIQNYNSIKDYYLRKIYDTIPTYHRDKLSLLDLTKVDFFLEITNPDIIVSESIMIHDPQVALDSYNIPTSYTLAKLTNPDQKAYAYTDTISPKINIPDGFGPYVIKEVNSIKSSDTKTISNSINPVNYFKSYPFKLQTSYSYQTATDKPLVFSGKYSTNIEILYQGVGEFEQQKPVGTVIRNWTSTETNPIYVPPSGTQTPIVSPGTPLNNIPCTNIKSVIDMFAPQGQINATNGFRWRSFDYTWDINTGNGSATIRQGSTGEYITFIQTALKAGGFYASSIDGIFGSVTLSAVVAFQNFMKQYKPVYTNDGSVDSETKSHIAYCIKNNIRNMGNRNIYQQNNAIKFYNAVFRQKELNRINEGERHRKISYSGTIGEPIENVQDVLFFTIPSGIKTVKSVVIDLGTESDRWMNYRVVKYGWSSQDKSNLITRIPDIWPQYTTRDFNQAPDQNGKIILNVEQDITVAKYMYVHIRSFATIGPRFGAAEGYQINSIVCNGVSLGGSVPTVEIGEQFEVEEIENAETYVAFPSLKKPEIQDVADFYLEGTTNLFYDGSDLKSDTEGFLLYTIEDDEYWSWDDGQGSWDNVVFDPNDEIIKRIEDRSKTFTYTVDAVVSAIDSGQFNFLNPSSAFSKRYDTQSIKSFNLLFNNVSYTYLGQTYNDLLGTGLGLSTSSHRTSSGVTFDFTKPSYTYITSESSVTVFDVISESGSVVTSPLSAISIQYFDVQNPLLNKPTGFSLKTLGTYYSGSDVITTNPQIINSYTMMDINKKQIPSKESVTILDGIVLLCNSGGKPTGIPTGNEISSVFPNSLVGQERDSRFGFIYVNNTINDNSGGFIYGFYDIQEKEFLGQKISYVDLLSRGLNNIYLGVLAIDADGNSANQIDFIGPKVSTTFIPVDIPIKRICPVYSVSFSSNSAIQIGKLGSFIDKKESWPLPITSGSFIKKINLETNSIFFDWKSKYLGQTLLATYDTSSVSYANWSAIFGKGFYDVKNEKPIIISDRQIKLRQAPFLVWPEPSNYSLAIAGIFKPKFEVYTRSSEENNWVKIDFSKVRDYDAESGIIQFNERIVPSNENLIKVNYVKVSPDLQIYNVNGAPIPLNPFLNYETIKLNKALYIYLMPSKIDKLSNIVSLNKYVPLEEYSPESPVNFTYDYQMFNSSSIKYDPFALLIGIIYFINNPNKKQTKLSDTRLRGGGIKANIGLLELDEDNKNAINNWDTHPLYGTSYAKGGYVIIKLPEEVKQNFNSVQEIYDIVRSNLTAGVSFEIQNLNGEPWEI